MTIPIVLTTIALAIGGPDAAREYPTNTFSLTAGQNHFRGAWDNETIGFNYYGPELFLGVVVVGLDYMGEGSTYFRVGHHQQFSLGDDWLLGAQYGLGIYSRGTGPGLGRGVSTIFYAQTGLGYSITDNSNVWLWATHHSNFNRGESNPTMWGLKIELTINFN